MNPQLLYLTIIRVLIERQEMPVEMLSLKIGFPTSIVLESLEKLERINAVKLDNEKRNVSLCDPGSIPSMNQFYTLAS
jgi:hypothetical protein